MIILKTDREGVKTSQALKDAGNTTEVAVQQNKALLLNAQGMLVDIENSIKVRENMFSILLGIVPGNRTKQFRPTKNYYRF
ncbi:MAG: hypothetical protein R2777_00550 [Chitinophagales bacterium]